MVQDRDVVTGLLSGVDEYLFKPVKMDDLLGAIERAIVTTAEQREQRALLMARDPTLGGNGA